MKPSKTQEAVFMDKKKTGILIKEARIKKNYTQSELGDLLGVTNKAVSRWENGDSFPDIGILENLSGILDLKIQDIVVGEISEDESGGKRENAITEVIRMARLQEKSRQKRIIFYLGGGICLLLYSLFLALERINGRMVFDKAEGAVYIVSLAVTLGIVLWSAWYGRRKQSVVPGRNKVSTGVLIIAAVTYLYEVFSVGIIVVMSANGAILHVGAWFYNSLIEVFFVNFAMLAVEAVRLAIESTKIHRGIFVSVSAMYAALLYSGMFNYMCTAEEELQMYIVRTVAVLVMMCCALLGFYFLQRRVNGGNDV